MTFIFWRKTIDIFHSVYLQNLAETHNVILVTEIRIGEDRRKDGFYIPDFGKVEVVVAPGEEKINDLLNCSSIHIFSGLNTYRLPTKALKLAVKRKLQIGIFMEPFVWMGIKGKLRFIKYFLLRLKYSKHIGFILTTGKRGRWCYESVGFLKSKIYDWAYFTETPKIEIKDHSGNLPKILFIGTINTNKNILLLIETCKRLNIIDQLSIIGTGVLEDDLREKIKGTKCNYLGKVPNKEVHQKIADSDVLILPSLYDGWGAVINEALMCGTPVIASDRCGASILLRGNRGRVFSIKKNNLEAVMSDFLLSLPYNQNVREEIRAWALQNISGEAAAKYLEEIIEHVEEKTTRCPVAPWLR